MADLEQILYGNREILPVDIFGGLESAMDKAFDARIRQKVEKLVT